MIVAGSTNYLFIRKFLATKDLEWYLQRPLALEILSCPVSRKSLASSLLVLPSLKVDSHTG